MALGKDLLSDIALTQGSILERIDEYSLYCYYLGYEPIPGKRYRSPIRPDDENPSFNIFYSTAENSEREFLWRDQAVGVVGDIFMLVQLMSKTPITKLEAQEIIAADFGLSNKAIPKLEKITFHKPPKKSEIKINVHSRPFTLSELDYWGEINITPSILSEYFVTAFDFYWLSQDQVVPFTSGEFSFAYRIENRYKLYWPFADRDKKFRNDYLRTDIEGLIQAKFNDQLLVITKSLKDVMFLKSIGITSISPKSENTIILPEQINLLRPRYKNIITLFDNDGKHLAAEYEVPAHEIPLETGFKDPTDLARGVGVKSAKDILYKIFNKYL